MKFLIRKRRTTPAVIIVALIDVLIVLVIFLLVTTTFKQVPSLQLTLPASRQALKPGVSDNPPQVVTIAAKGELFLGPILTRWTRCKASSRRSPPKTPDSNSPCARIKTRPGARWWR